MKGTAVFSPDKLYRYSLTRSWGYSPRRGLLVEG